MTRFARAKGSKASNERTPEDGTPWEVMKEQLNRVKKDSEEAKKREEAEKQRLQNYENFLQQRKVEKRPATWCDFPAVEQRKVKSDENDTQPPKKKKKNKKNKVSSDQDTVSKTDTEVAGISKKKTKKNKLKNQNVNSEDTTSDFTNEVNEETSDKSKKKKKCVNLSVHASEEHESPSDNQPTKNKKDKKKKQSDTSNGLVPNVVNEEKHDVETDGKIHKQKKNKFKKQSDTGDDNFSHREPNKKLNNQNQGKKKKNKFVDGKPIRRKEINDKSFQIIINGKEVELVRFDGFPIMRKDAERLTELKQNMIKKGIPKSEVQRTMKLERRRAEKALARVKRDVCYNCRKGGHNLSDCPELKSKIPGVETADGVCFKCGSTEHRQFECKVQKDNEFRFASCFICKEQGHIARQCPDNPKGLYPNGGCCKLCGDVTHLRKDCPTANNKKEETSMKLQMLDNTDNIEDIGLQNKTEVAKESSKLPKKIKF